VAVLDDVLSSDEEVADVLLPLYDDEEEGPVGDEDVRVL